MITLYDLPSRTPIQAWSPNTWKARLTLNYKALPYQTEWVEWPDIKSLYKKNNIKATATNRDGGEHYTLPVIHDSATGAFVSESFNIAKYLDKTYPDTPKVVPSGGDEESEEMKRTLAFIKEYDIAFTHMIPTAIKACMAMLTPAGRAHFAPVITALEDAGGAAVDQGKAPVQDNATFDEERKKQWAEFKTHFDRVTDGRFGGKDELAWFTGDKISFSDFIVASALIFYNIIWGENSEEWKSISSWNSGKWATMMRRMEPYRST